MHKGKLSSAAAPRVSSRGESVRADVAVVKVLVATRISRPGTAASTREDGSTENELTAEKGAPSPRRPAGQADTGDLLTS
jgi:hypothetical protein